MDLIPPSSPEAEKAVIGCCLMDHNCTSEAQISIGEDHFYDVRCQSVWNIITGMDSGSANIITVGQRLSDTGFVNASDFIRECCDLVVSTANLPSWISELIEKRSLRRIIQTCHWFSAKAMTGRADDLLEEFEKEALSIRPQRREGNSIKSLVHSAIAVIEHQCKNRGSISGLSTNLADLNSLTDGMHNGEMIVIAGFPSTGKTALAVGIAVTLGLHGMPVAIFSAEMTPVRLVVRAMCSNARINFRDLDEEKTSPMINVAGRLAASPIHIERANGLSIGQVVAMARRLKQKHDIKLVVIDYLQLLSGVGDNREQQVSSISKGIKAMALELDVPVLALSQLTDDGKLRESRAIGQDADSIWKLENDGEWKPDTQPVKLRVEKSRDGQTGSVDLTFLKTITRFESAGKDYGH